MVDPSFASVVACSSDSSCAVSGLSPGETNLDVSGSNSFYGLSGSKMKPVLVTPSSSPPNQCTDSAGLTVPCGGGCVVADIQVSNSCNPTGIPIQPVTSIDPNDKVGSQGVGAQQYTSGASPLRYAVYFANQTTATAPAEKVTITDQLDATNDNLGSLSLGPITFGSQLLTPSPLQTSYSTTVDLRPATNLLVAVNGNLNSSTGLLTWNFQSLDPSTGLPPTDPTLGFLPPGVGGSAFFTVMPKQGLATNTQIQNQAIIIFDVNAAIATPTWLNTLDNTPPTSSVQPLPSTEPTSAFTLSWSGTDVGAGVQDFTIYASDNGGSFTAFLTNTTATSASLRGRPGTPTAFIVFREI